MNATRYTLALRKIKSTNLSVKCIIMYLISMGEIIKVNFGDKTPKRNTNEALKTNVITSTMTLIIPAGMYPETTSISFITNRDYRPLLIYAIPDRTKKQHPTQEEIAEALLERKRVEILMVGQKSNDIFTIDYFDKGRIQNNTMYMPSHHAITYLYGDKGWMAIKKGIQFNAKDGPPPPTHGHE